MINPNKNTETMITILILNSDLIAVRFSNLISGNSSLTPRQSPRVSRGECAHRNSNVTIFHLFNFISSFEMKTIFLQQQKVSCPPESKNLFLKGYFQFFQKIIITYSTNPVILSNRILILSNFYYP
jgi:hypothetical protein